VRVAKPAELEAALTLSYVTLEMPTPFQTRLVARFSIYFWPRHSEFGLPNEQGFTRQLMIAPRLLTRKQAAEYCRLSLQGFSEWVKRGIVPPALPGTTRWDLKAIDAALDRASGLTPTSMNALDQWRAARAAKRTDTTPVK
jgi:hypothetical protein